MQKRSAIMGLFAVYLSLQAGLRFSYLFLLCHRQTAFFRPLSELRLLQPPQKIGKRHLHVIANDSKEEPLWYTLIAMIGDGSFAPIIVSKPDV